MDLDSFFVSCERLLDNRLLGKPVLIGGLSDRGVVASCSYEARIFGVHSAMPMRLARQLCPEAIVIRGNSAAYSKYSEEVTAIIRESVPVFEKTSIDEFYIDFSGTEKFFGSLKLSSELRQKIMKETGLPISFGLSTNKTVSKIATGEIKPNNQMQVLKGTEKAFLSPLAVQKIPMIGEKTSATLYSLGVRKIKTLQEMPVEVLQNVFGKPGVEMWEKANGIDDSLVVPFQERKSISTERTFDKDTIDVKRLRHILTGMTEDLASQLRRSEKLTACITIKIRYSDFSTFSVQRKIDFTSADHKILPLVYELFEKLYNKRLLVRLIGVKFSNLVNGGFQFSLFDQEEEVTNLYTAIDKLREQFGENAVMRACANETKPMGPKEKRERIKKLKRK